MVATDSPEYSLRAVIIYIHVGHTHQLPEGKCIELKSFSFWFNTNVQTNNMPVAIIPMMRNVIAVT
jgi:hypothetical protein